MSYEGYSQFLCVRGHYWTEDCNSVDPRLEENFCPKCISPAVWENMVNITNGSYDEDGKQIDGYVELEPLAVDTCDKCYSVLEQRFKIPQKQNPNKS